MKSQALLFVSALAMCLAGCRSGTEKVIGEIVGLNPATNRLQPVATGYIRFYSGRKVYTGQIVDGRFIVLDVPRGETRITVESHRPTASPRVPDANAWFEIPERFQHIETTPLKWTVQSGSNPLVISLVKGTVEERRWDSP